MKGISHDPKISFRMLIPYGISFFFALVLIAGAIYVRSQERGYIQHVTTLTSEKDVVIKKLDEMSKTVETLKNEDQRIRNDTLERDLRAIEKTYTEAVTVYESLLRLKEKSAKTAKLDSEFSSILSLLSQRSYATASSELSKLAAEIKKQEEAIIASFIIPTNVPVNNTAPAGGYSRQNVASDIGNFLVDVIAGDLSSTRAVVDSASDSDCANDCPVLSLGEYITRNGGYAGINGSYFCPATYPSCQEKKNSFDTLLMNKNKKYINSDNNVYSTVPAVIFLGGSVRFVGQSLEWGRDTNNDGVLANQPLLLMGGNVMFGGDADPKKGSKGMRSFVANKGNTVYIGVVHNATVAECARVLKAMGMENAINLDSGGSTALYYSGYKVGPGRNIPNAIIFVRR